MKRLMILLASCVLICAAPTCEGRDTTRVSRMWVTGGFGGGSSGLGLYASGNAALGKNGYLVFRTAGGNEMTLSSLGSASPLQTFRDFGVLAGLRSPGERWGSLSAAAGLAYATGTARGNLIREGAMFSDSEYESVSISTVGIPVECQAVLKLGRQAGLGLMWWSNLNFQHVSSGWLLTLSAGNFK